MVTECVSVNKYEWRVYLYPERNLYWVKYRIKISDYICFKNQISSENNGDHPTPCRNMEAEKKSYGIY